MADGINSDRVTVNAGGDGGGGNLGMIAALLGKNNNEANNGLNAALPLLLADRSRPEGDGFGGMNGILGIAALGLIF